MVNQVSYGWQNSPNAAIIGNGTGLHIQRHIEINSN
jgi:hypothetical protein